jgi:predicted P-loop ATPase
MASPLDPVAPQRLRDVRQAEPQKPSAPEADESRGRSFTNPWGYSVENASSQAPSSKYFRNLLPAEYPPAIAANPTAFALAFAQRAIRVFPVYGIGERGCRCSKHEDCKDTGKHPMTKNGFKDACVIPDRIRDWFSVAGCNLAVLTGESLLVLDVDPRNGGSDSLDALEAKFGPIPRTVSVLTGGGGIHYYFQSPMNQPKSGGLAGWPGIDIKCRGGYVVAPPSMHASGVRYAFVAGQTFADITIAEPPPWLIQMLEAANAQREIPAYDGPILAADGGWLVEAFRTAGWLTGRKGTQNALHCVCPWDHEHTTGSAGDGGTVVFPATPGKTMGWFECKHSHCTGRTLDDVKAALPSHAVDAAESKYPKRKPGGSTGPTVKRAEYVTKERSDGALEIRLSTERDGGLVPDPTYGIVEEGGSSDPIWNGPPEGMFDDFIPAVSEQDEPRGRLRVVYGELANSPKGGKVKSEDNLKIILRDDPAWAGMFQQNRMTTYIEYTRTPPIDGFKRDPDAHGFCTIRDHDIGSIRQWIEHEYMMTFPTEFLWNVVTQLADKANYHPVAKYLEALVWDGVPRLADLFPIYFGAARTPLVELIGKKFAIQAVARGISPGTKADAMLILEGKQGKRKSLGIETLAGSMFYGAGLGGEIGSRDSIMGMSTSWLIEQAEMQEHARAQREAFKAFLTVSVDKVRAPYARTTISLPRTSVFIGTTNEKAYLRDWTGARRFWPVRVERLVDIDAIARDRDMIWAEAVVRYKSGEPWWITDEDDEFKLEREQLKRREDEHAWAPSLKRMLVQKEGMMGQGAYIIMDDALEKLHIEVSKANWATSRQIGEILREAGWDRFKKRVGRDCFNAFRPTRERWEEIAADNAARERGETDDDE